MSAKASSNVLKVSPLMEATELLRDLIRATEWLMETEPVGEARRWESEELRQYLGEAKTFVRDQDGSGDAAERERRQPSLYA